MLMNVDMNDDHECLCMIVMSKEENIGNIGNIGSPKTRKYRWKYRDNIDIDKNYMETTEIVRKTWKFLLKLCRMFI